jgi:hypothetical protein
MTVKLALAGKASAACPDQKREATASFDAKVSLTEPIAAAEQG